MDQSRNYSFFMKNSENTITFLHLYMLLSIRTVTHKNDQSLYIYVEFPAEDIAKQPVEFISISSNVVSNIEAKYKKTDDYPFHMNTEESKAYHIVVSDYFGGKSTETPYLGVRHQFSLVKASGKLEETRRN